MHEEPVFTINGRTCSIGEAMTIRCAVESFSYDLMTDGLGDDEHGKKMVDLYMASIERIRDKMYNRTRGT